MNESGQTRTDGEDAWGRHYLDVARRREEAARRGRGRATRPLLYRQREVRLAYALVAVVAALLFAAWASF